MKYVFRASIILTCQHSAEGSSEESDITPKFPYMYTNRAPLVPILLLIPYTILTLATTITQWPTRS